ncbi:MAG: hypothetical protein LH645_08870 [Actinomycetia bacterium]|nr:hypothetical protein [Actinomycetes bacterium]
MGRLLSVARSAQGFFEHVTAFFDMVAVAVLIGWLGLAGVAAVRSLIGGAIDAQTENGGP